MVLVVGIRFKRAGKVYHFDPSGIKLVPGDRVIVETVRGIEMGRVVTDGLMLEEKEVVQPLKKVLRKASEEDIKQLAANKEKERKALQVATEKIVSHKLPMKLVGVEYSFDASKIIFYFTAEGRIDFRDLVRDLAAIFHTRIELRQIGVRDEAKLIGGLGSCGRELCCAAWLNDFASVSIRMAKEQNLSLNPAKISGICGRLMCCLKYENEVYEKARIEFPELGSRVITADGEGKLCGINIFKKAVNVELKESKTIKDYPLDQISLKGMEEDDGKDQAKK